MTKKLRLFILVILVLVTAGTFLYYRGTRQIDVEIPSTTNSANVYENNEYGFCFNYPDSISITDVSEATKSTFALNLLLQGARTSADTAPEQSPSNQMHLTVNPLERISFEEYVMNNQPPTEPSSKTDVFINGLRGIKLQAYDAFGGSPTESVYILLKNTPTSSDVVISATYYLGTPYALSFAQILESVRAKKASAGCD